MSVSTRVRVAPVVAVGLAAFLLVGCSGSDDSDGAISSPTASSPSESASPSAERSKAPTDPDSVEPTGSGSASRLPDPVVSKYTPVIRAGKTPKPTVTAGQSSFDDPIRWQDGLTLTVDDVAHGKTTGQGPGVIVGEPKTTVKLTMNNESSKPVSLDGVVVTMLYGDKSQQARPIYDGTDDQDLVGRIKPGGSAKAVYSFSVPTSQLGNVVMYVDFDGVHTVGKFKGSVR